MVEQLRFIHSLPREPGTYVLILFLPEGKTLTIGRLGSIAFHRGFFAYVGSAFGPGGLAARVGRHLQPASRYHWHMDYLRAYVQPQQIWYSTHSICLEHLWAQALVAKSEVCRAIAGFGCSDCACPSHLFHFQRNPAPHVLPTTHSVQII